jgi:hypothetical protein
MSSYVVVTSLTKIKSFISSLTPEEVIWIERVSDETGFVENSVPKFRPFSDEDFCGVAKSFRRRVEVLQESERQGSQVALQQMSSNFFFLRHR